jgi:hypothetical protein
VELTVVLAVAGEAVAMVVRPELLAELETLQINHQQVVTAHLRLRIKVLMVVMELTLLVEAAAVRAVQVVLLVPVLLVLAVWVNYQPSLVHLFITLAAAVQDKEIHPQLAPAVLVLVEMVAQK